MILKEAIQALESGELNSFVYSGRTFHKGDINNTVSNPVVKPQVEEVEVVRWGVVTPDGSCAESYDCPEKAQTHCLDGDSVVKLTGTYQRPVHPKVKRRVRVGTARDFLTHNEPCPDHADLFAEWLEEADQ